MPSGATVCALQLLTLCPPHIDPHTARPIPLTAESGGAAADTKASHTRVWCCVGLSSGELHVIDAFTGQTLHSWFGPPNADGSAAASEEEQQKKWRISTSQAHTALFAFPSARSACEQFEAWRAPTHGRIRAPYAPLLFACRALNARHSSGSALIGTHTTTQHSLGCVLVEMVSGKVSKPFLVSSSASAAADGKNKEEEEMFAVTKLWLYQCASSALHPIEAGGKPSPSLKPAPASAAASASAKELLSAQSVAVISEQRTASAARRWHLNHLSTGRSVLLRASESNAASCAVLNDGEALFAVGLAGEVAVWDLLRRPTAAVGGATLIVAVPEYAEPTPDSVVVDRHRLMCCVQRPSAAAQSDSDTAATATATAAASATAAAADTLPCDDVAVYACAPHVKRLYALSDTNLVDKFGAIDWMTAHARLIVCRSVVVIGVCHVCVSSQQLCCVMI